MCVFVIYQCLQVATTTVLELLGDPSKWEEARSLMSSPPLSSQDFVKTLDRYSDSNWEKHILGDLYRNEGLASLKVTGRLLLREEEQAKCSREFSVRFETAFQLVSVCSGKIFPAIFPSL